MPYSCAAWIESIDRGIDVARAAGITHIAGATGASSEKAVQKLFSLPETALIDMGDFVGGLLNICRHPVARVTIAGGFAKMTKLAQACSTCIRSAARSISPHSRLCARRRRSERAERIAAANTAAEAFAQGRGSGSRSATRSPRAAWQTALGPVADSGTPVEIVVVDREGAALGLLPMPPAKPHEAPPRNRRR